MSAPININITVNGNACNVRRPIHAAQYPKYALSHNTGPVSYPNTRQYTINPYNPAFTLIASPYQYARISPYNKYDY